MSISTPFTLCLPVLLVQLASAQLRCDVRRIDFRNFQFALPDRPPDEAPSFKVMTGANSRSWTLRGGKSEGPAALDENDAGYTSVVVRQIEYGDVTGDQRTEAIVSLDAGTGGSQHWGFIFVYSCVRGAVKVLEVFRAGDRASEGLRRAYANKGQLVIEVNDPDRASADCCSDGMIRRKFTWSTQRFVPVGPAERLDLPDEAKRAK